MSALQDALVRYIDVRRALGSKLVEPAATLAQFVAFIDRDGSARITTDLALQWAMAPQGVQRATWARRLSMVRRFATWLSATDPYTEVPPYGALPARRRRRRPHIFTDAEVARLMIAAAQRPSRTGLRPLTYTTLIGLLAATGLRPGEALALDMADVDLETGLLTIRQTKFGKSRVVPLETSTRDALHEYVDRRHAICVRPQSPAFLLAEQGRRLRGNAARRMFAVLSCAVGLRPRLERRRWGRGPRLQDFRHTFATRRLLEWYEAGVDVSRELPKLATYLGHVDIGLTYWYIDAIPELLAHATTRLGSTPCAGRPAMSGASFPALVHRFFTERLVTQQDASSHTVAAYRDTFRLLLRFVQGRLGRAPSKLRIEDLDVTCLEAFLAHLEQDRANHPRTRNQRLSALHGFFRFVALSEPALSLQCQRILAIPAKRSERGPVAFLTDDEVKALIAAPDATTWIGRRDRALLVVAVQTGLRNSEITALRWQDVEIEVGAHIRCVGKGRKTRATPLRPDVVSVLKDWLTYQSGPPTDPVFPSSRGGRMSADALQRLVTRHMATARRVCPSLDGKVVTPHTLRHTAAMALLQRGVDLSVIGLWLGHESTETTETYLHADLSLKERALAHATPSGVVPERYRPPDPLIAFLEGL